MGFGNVGRHGDSYLVLPISINYYYSYDCAIM